MKASKLLIRGLAAVARESSRQKRKAGPTTTIHVTGIAYEQTCASAPRRAG
jgi:hypothetical protein